MRIPDKERLSINHQRMNKSSAETTDSAWKSLYRIGGAAALIAGVIFRRNLGPEMSLVSGTSPPCTALDWFTLLQNNRFLGLAFLNVFDMINFALVGLMFLALYIALRETNGSYMLIATTFGFVGITVYFASNPAFSMLSLSDRYAAATTDAQRSMLLAAGETILAINNPGAICQDTGIYTSFLLLAVAGLMISSVMLQSDIFSRITAYAGILASMFDLTYCIALVFAPAISVFFVAAAGLFLMIWHILIGRRLYLLGHTLYNNST